MSLRAPRKFRAPSDRRSAGPFHFRASVAGRHVKMAGMFLKSGNNDKALDLKDARGSAGKNACAGKAP